MMMRNLRMLFELVPLAAVLVPQLVKGDVGQPGEIEKAEDLKVYITASSPFFYWTSFFLACFVCAVLHRMANSEQNSGSGGSKPSELIKADEFVKFQRNWLTVYLMAMFADWLQGPYVYALYDSYGFDKFEIAQLFVAGFGSSMIMGTIVGALSDKYGRRRMCLLFALFYILSALTKLYNSFHLLLLGRLLSGVATSLLFSTFDAWMVCEHNARGYDPRLLGDTFGKVAFGNGVVAVVAGLVASAVADNISYVAPFVLSIVPLTLLALIVSRDWNENYGDSLIDVATTFKNAYQVLRKKKHIAFLGAAQSSYEGAMYTFVFMWTPALSSPGGPAVPFGLVFAVFMVCVMIGSNIFRMLEAQRLNLLPVLIHATAATAMLSVSIFLEHKFIVYMSFLLFEVTCGMFWSTYGTIRAHHVPEENRAAISNFFRVPLNAFVVLLLLRIKSLDMHVVFLICAVVHAGSLLLYFAFVNEAKVQYYAPIPQSAAAATSPSAGGAEATSNHHAGGGDHHHQHHIGGGSELSDLER